MSKELTLTYAGRAVGDSEYRALVSLEQAHEICHRRRDRLMEIRARVLEVRNEMTMAQANKALWDLYESLGDAQYKDWWEG